MIKIKRRFPNCFTGFEETEHLISNRTELENIDWIVNIINNKSYYSLAISKNDYDNDNHMLMVLNNYDDNYGGCKSWWVIGYISGDDVDSLKLPNYDYLCGDHKNNCPQKSYQYNKCTCGFNN